MLLQKINNKKGFTLIELMVVIITIAILAAVVIPHACSVSVKTSTEVITQQDEQEVNKDTQPVPKQKEIKKQKDRMNKL